VVYFTLELVKWHVRIIVIAIAIRVSYKIWKGDGRRDFC